MVKDMKNFARQFYDLSFFDTSSDLLKVSLIKDNKIIFDKELHTKMIIQVI